MKAKVFQALTLWVLLGAIAVWPARALAPITLFSQEQNWAWEFGFNPAIVSPACHICPRQPYDGKKTPTLDNFASLKRQVLRLVSGEFENFPETLIREYYIDLSEQRYSRDADLFHEILHDLYFTAWIGVEGRKEFEELVRRHAWTLQRLIQFDIVKMIADPDPVERAIHFSEIFVMLVSVLYRELNLPVEKPAPFHLISRWNHEVPIPPEIRAWLLEKNLFRPDLVKPTSWLPQPDRFPQVRVSPSIADAAGNEIEFEASS